MTGVLDDLRRAARSLRRAPGFTITAALTLALGVGATTTLVSALDTLLFRPSVGVEQSDRIIRAYFQHANPQFGRWINSVVSYPDFTDLGRATSLAGIAAQNAMGGSLGRGAEAEPVDLLAVTGNYFQLLGTRPLLGRLLTPEDDRADNGAPALVLSEGLWRTRFGGDPTVIGRTVPIDNQVYTVCCSAGPLSGSIRSTSDSPPTGSCPPPLCFRPTGMGRRSRRPPRSPRWSNGSTRCPAWCRRPR